MISLYGFKSNYRVSIPQDSDLVYVIMQSKSEWAKRYGGNPKWNNKRSGYTPVKPVIPDLNNQPTAAQLSDFGTTLKFQREQLFNLTTQQLIDLGAISNALMKPSDLPEVIIPFLAKGNWSTGNNSGAGDIKFRGYPIDRGIQGVVCIFSSTYYSYLRPIREYSSISGALNYQNEILEYSRTPYELFNQTMLTAQICSGQPTTL